MLLFPIFVASLTGAVGDQRSYRGYSLLSLTPQTQDQFLKLRDWAQSTRFLPSDERPVDIWREPHQANQSMDVVVSPDFRNEFLQLIDDIPFSVRIQDLQTSIDAENPPVAALPSNSSSWDRRFHDAAIGRRRWRKGRRPFNFRRYHSLDEIHNYMRWLAKKYPHIVQVTTIGRGHEGGDLVAMQIASSKGYTRRKPTIWLDGGIHAREWISPATVLYFITQLVEGYQRRDRKVRLLVDRIFWYFLPVVNPDGYRHTFTNDRLWRKNRRPRQCNGNNAWIRCCDWGVDLNRNFDWHHCGEGASTNPCSEVFCGQAPFSEPESAAVSKYVKALKEQRNLQAFLTFHSFSQYWLYPYGHAKQAYADNRKELSRLAHKAVRALKRVNKTNYTVGTAADILYEAAGGSDDWAHGVAGIRWVYLIELPPCDDCPDQFLLPPSKIRKVGRETWPAVRTVASHVLRVWQRENSQRTRRRGRR